MVRDKLHNVLQVLWEIALVESSDVIVMLEVLNILELNLLFL